MVKQIITIPYKPRLWATKLHNSFKRYFSLIIHRRGGKTTGLINHFQRAATDDAWEANRMRALVPDISKDDLKMLMRNRFYGIVYPTYSQAKTTAWDMMKYYADPIPGVRFNESELTVKYPTGSKCRLFGSDNPDALRGPAFWGIGFDEYSQQPPNIFGEILSKSLADHLGFAVFAGTIKGKNQLYRTNEVAKQNPDDWDYIWQDIDESFKREEGITIQLLKQALEDDRKLVVQGMMTQEEFDQEWYLATEAAIKGAYYSAQFIQARGQGRIKIVPYDSILKVHTVWDLGVGQHLGIGFYQRLSNEMHMIDYWEGESKEGIPTAVKVLQNKLYIYGTHFMPHDAEGTEQGTEMTRLATFKSLWPNAVVEIVPKMLVDDGINQGKLLFSRLWIDEKKCQQWLDAVSAYHQEWDEKRGMPKSYPHKDWTSHAADVHRYAALAESQMTNEDFLKEQTERFQINKSRFELRSNK